MNRYVIAITGASGMIYARELLAYFASRPDLELHAVISEAGAQVWNYQGSVQPSEQSPAIAAPSGVDKPGAATGETPAFVVAAAPTVDFVVQTSDNHDRPTEKVPSPVLASIIASPLPGGAQAPAFGDVLGV